MYWSKPIQRPKPGNQDSSSDFCQCVKVRVYIIFCIPLCFAHSWVREPSKFAWILFPSAQVTRLSRTLLMTTITSHGQCADRREMRTAEVYFGLKSVFVWRIDCNYHRLWVHTLWSRSWHMPNESFDGIYSSSVDFDEKIMSGDQDRSEEWAMKIKSVWWARLLGTGEKLVALLEAHSRPKVLVSSTAVSIFS